MSAVAEVPQPPSLVAEPVARERAPLWMLAVAAIGAGYFVWLMFESGFDLRIRSRITELAQLAQQQPLAASRHPYVASFTLEPNGAVRMTLKGEPELEGRKLAFIPQTVENKVVGWRCMSDAPRRFLPRNCNT